MRIGPGVVDALARRLSALADQAVRKAQGLARAGAQTTILERDLVEAFQTVLPSGDAASAHPAVVFAQLDRMTTEQLAYLVSRIQDWLQARPR